MVTSRRLWIVRPYSRISSFVCLPHARLSLRRGQRLARAPPYTAALLSMLGCAGIVTNQWGSLAAPNIALLGALLAAARTGLPSPSTCVRGERCEVYY